MIRALLILCLMSTLATSAHAQSGGCYVDYKAQRTAGGQLQLHYGVMQLGNRACNNASVAKRTVAQRIGADGWKLLRVVSRFDRGGLQSRRANAGKYFLRY